MLRPNSCTYVKGECVDLVDEYVNLVHVFGSMLVNPSIYTVMYACCLF